MNFAWTWSKFNPPFEEVENFSNMKLIVAYWNNQYSVRRVKSKISWWRKRVDLYFSKQDNLVIDKFQAKISCWIKNKKTYTLRKCIFQKKCTFKKCRAVGQSCLLPLWVSVSFAQMEWHSSKSGAATLGKFWSNKIDFLRLFYFPAGAKWSGICWGQEGKKIDAPPPSKANSLKCADSINQNTTQ